MAEDKGMDTEAKVDHLILEVRAAEDRMNRLRDRMANEAQWRALKLSQLKQIMPVVQIAERLGVTRQAIYSAIDETPPDWELERPGRPDLPERLREYADQLRRMVATQAKVSIGPVGAGFLVEDIDEAIGELAKVYKGQEPLK